MTDYSVIYHEEILRFKQSLQDEFDNEEFPWDQLIHVFLLDNSPLKEIFTRKTVIVAGICQSAFDLYKNSERLISSNTDEYFETDSNKKEVNDVNLEGDW